MELATASRLSRQPQRRLKTRPEVAVQRQTRGIHRMVTT
jgi:hypothetical protein